MPNPVLRVSLPGYDALTDTNPDHFALYSDQNWVLIKEFARGSVSIPSGSQITITHNLGYVPYFSAFALGSFIVNGTNETGYLQCSSGGAITPPVYTAYADTTTFNMINNAGATTNFFYYVFYDQQV